MERRTRWMYPPIGFAINIALGTIYSWSVFRIPLEKLFSWSMMESSLPFTVFLAVFALTMPVAGRIMGAIGPKKTALLGAVLVGLGWILARFVEFTPWPLGFMLLFYGVIGGTGVGLVYGVPIAVSSKWIPERKGLATGITILGFGLSPLITAITSAYLISQVGVLNTFLYLGAAFAVILLALSVPLGFPPANWQAPSSLAAKKPTAFAELKTSEMIRTRNFAGIWLTYVFGTTGGFIAISFAAKYGSDVFGLAPAMAAIITGVFAIFNGLGRPTFGYLCDRINIKKVAMLSFGVIILAGIAATRATIIPLYILSFALLWFTFGGWLAIAPAATSTFFGLKNIGANYGIVFTAYGVGAIVGPMASSFIYSITKSYVPAFLATVVLAAMGLAVAHFTYRPPKLAPEIPQEIHIKT